MSFLPGLFFRRRQTAVLGICLMVAWGSLVPMVEGPLLAQDTSSPAQEPAADNTPAAADGAVYIPAMDLLPQSTAGVLRIPDFPDFCEAWKKTHIGQLTEEPVMEPFLATQKKRAKNFLNSVDKRE